MGMSATDPVMVRAGLLRLRLLDEDQGILHVSCEGEASMPDFQGDDDPLAGLLGPGVYGRQVLLSLDRVRFLDTSGVTWLMNLHERFHKAGGKVVLHSVPAQARYVLRLLNLDQVLPIVADAAAGRALLGGKKV
jgi:anti-anti-sigma factor